MPDKILIVDDDTQTAEYLRSFLEAASFHVRTVTSGTEALAAVELEEPSLVVLDIILPGMNGFDVIRHVRQRSKVPILVLSGLCAPTERVHGLEIGADDYLSKPYMPAELVARIRAILRRANPEPEATTIRRGALEIDPARREIRMAGTVLHSTNLEFDLLRFLASRPGVVVDRRALMRAVWGTDRIGDTRAVDNLVSRLRHKLELDPSRPRILTTVWGAGYRFEDPDNLPPS